MQPFSRRMASIDADHPEWRQGNKDGSQSRSAPLLGINQANLCSTDDDSEK